MCITHAILRLTLRALILSVVNRKPHETFLANDVTLVTSYGYCQSLKINDIRVLLSVMSVLRFVRLGGYPVRRWVGVCTRTLKLLPYQRHKPVQLMLWE